MCKHIILLMTMFIITINSLVEGHYYFNDERPSTTSFLISEGHNIIVPSPHKTLADFIGDSSSPSDNDLPTSLLVLAKYQWNFLRSKHSYQQEENNTVIAAVNNDNYYYNWKAKDEEDSSEGFGSNSSESEIIRENPNKEFGVQHSNDYYFYSYQSLSGGVDKIGNLPTTMPSLPESDWRSCGSVHFNQGRNDNVDPRGYNNSSYYYYWQFGNEH